MNATYRLQLTRDFGFAQVQHLIPYFAALGVSHLYLSPITESRAGSSHGYDVTDHNLVREELGGEDGFHRLRQACVEAGLALILDFVPNHAGVGPRNASWQDVLAYGPHSPSARYFDIDWASPKQELADKLLLPFLGRTYGEALDAGEICLVWEDRLYAAYFDHRFALRPLTYAAVLERLLPALERTEAYWDAKELYDAYADIGVDEVQRAEALLERFRELAARVPVVPVLEEIQSAELHEILEQQFWRLSYWKTAGYEINYRRFFDINELVALRMEDGEVFFHAHALLGQLLREEGVAGVRIDHVDGLCDPHEYLNRLRELGARQIWVEKILAGGERIPPEWPVAGTTGYEFMNDAMRVLNWPQGELGLGRVYRGVVRHSPSFHDTVYNGKRLVTAVMLSGELFRLAYGLDRLSEADYRTRDFTLEALHEALAEVVATFGRYRTYLPYQEDADVVIRTAIHEARRRTRAFEPSVYDFIFQMLMGPAREDLEEQRKAWVARFQQYTAPVAAKGTEDTAFYRFVLLSALNEVGGEPDRFSQTADVFHAHARFYAFKYPRNLLTTATHDHKRGEDLRMRLIVLSEMPEAWRRTVRALERARQRFRGERGPSATDAYLFYQVLVALWGSASVEELEGRLVDYMTKAAREAKVDTSWGHPDGGYEADLERFVRRMVYDRWVARAIAPLSRNLSHHGFTNAISQVVLKLTAPGVPDFYQGTELLDLSLVDPDNRRPVDYEARMSLLQEIEPQLANPNLTVLRAWIETDDPRFKFYAIVRLLRWRRAHPGFLGSAYRALGVEGPAAEHVLAFAREALPEARPDKSEGEEGLQSEEAGTWAATIVPRFPSILRGAAGRAATFVELPSSGNWRDLLSGERVAGDPRLAFAELPLPWAVLVSERWEDLAERASEEPGAERRGALP